MPTPPRQTLDIRHESDVFRAREIGRATAEAIGFTAVNCEEIALVMIELATNLLQHAGGGELSLAAVSDNERAGLEIESSDKGPGIADVDLALTDRYSTTGSRGTGLGAVNRLMDELAITSPRGDGTRITCRKWLRNHPVSIRTCPLEVGVATRTRMVGEPNGDTFVVRGWDESLLVGVIDGLGHGQHAYRAAQAARQYVEGHYDRPLDQIFSGAGRACHATRGVVMALARFDWGCGRLSFASVGNIETLIFPTNRALSLLARRGIVGLNAPNAVVAEHAWVPGTLFILHSDGLRPRRDWNDIPGLTDRPAPAMATELLRLMNRDDDDATVLVVRNAIR